MIFKIMVWVLSTNDGVIGVFDNENELCLAIWHHKEELLLSGWMTSLEDVQDYEPTELNDYISRGSVIAYTLNIDYSTYRLPSWDEKLYNKER